MVSTYYTFIYIYFLAITKSFIFSLGFYADPIKMIKKRCEYFLNNLTESAREKNDEICLKFTTDGTNISRNVNLACFCFNIINEKLKAATAKGCYRIGVFPIDGENYEEINEWLPFLWEKCTSVKEIFYNKKNKKIYLREECNVNEDYQLIKMNHCFSADYKMELIVLGMYKANSKWPCIYCKQNKDSLHLLGNNFDSFK